MKFINSAFDIVYCPSCYSFLQEAIKVHTQKAALRNRRASESDSTPSIMAGGKPVNILQMLSKAQDEYDKVCYSMVSLAIFNIKDNACCKCKQLIRYVIRRIFLLCLFGLTEKKEKVHGKLKMQDGRQKKKNHIGIVSF